MSHFPFSFQLDPAFVSGRSFLVQNRRFHLIWEMRKTDASDTFFDLFFQKAIVSFS